MQRKETIQQLLKQLSNCGDMVFNCPDASLRPGSFEKKSQIDLQISNKNSRAEIMSLLRIRARIKNWLNIAEQLQKRYLNQRYNSRYSQPFEQLQRLNQSHKKIERDA